ncbi:MAG: hypothetical protein WED07_12295 [Candidatus Freyarchaeum deiterrae]
MSIINLEVFWPKRVKGEYNFESFREFYDWLSRNLSKPKRLKAIVTLCVAEDGSYQSGTTWDYFKVSFDRPLGYEVKSIARRTGFLRRELGLPNDFDYEKAYDFIEVIDRMVRER